MNHNLLHLPAAFFFDRKNIKSFDDLDSALVNTITGCHSTESQNNALSDFFAPFGISDTLFTIINEFKIFGNTENEVIIVKNATYGNDILKTVK